MSGRIDSSHLPDLQHLVELLSGGDDEAASVLIGCQTHLGFKAFELFCVEIDEKRLYDHRIWELFELCGHDVGRFVYHVDIELPNQETGKVRLSGPYALGCMNTQGFLERRRFGEPGSFWALENPPTIPNYEYPLS